AAPLSARHIEMLNRWLGTPTDQRMAPVPGDVASLEAVMRGNGAATDYHLFGALRNADPNLALDPVAGLVARLLTSSLEGVQGYLGAWPDPGLLRVLTSGPSTQPDQNGFSRMLTGVWRLQFDQFTLLSFHPEILAQVSRNLQFEKAERPAQIWLRTED